MVQEIVTDESGNTYFIKDGEKIPCIIKTLQRN